PSIGRLPAIQTLWLYANFFNGSIPAEIGNLSRLQQLGLAYNSFAPVRIPSEFGNLTKLTFLWMTKANLQGEIPASFAQLTGLTQLDLTQNSLTGAIPAGIWSLPNLQYLYLYKNNLSGSIVIDGTIGALGLVEIDLSMNQLTGSIPDDFGKLKNLSLLYLYYNRISGEIPASIGKLPSLSTLRLFSNGLTGVLPPELGKNSPLIDIEVDDNMISGELPDGLCDRGVFNSIVVFNNNLAGRIPPSLGKCSKLNNFQIHNNRFSGELPDGIWSAVNLTTVMVSNNNLTGRIPPLLGKCSQLTTLFVDGNRFSGEVPDGIWAAVNLTILVMNDNAFSGTLPHKLPPKLAWLEIVGNRFTGKIPSSAPSLVVFLASNNMFSGELPSDLAGLSTLELFYLGNNTISGRIPQDISLLKSLAELNLRHNQLTGEIPTSIGSLKQPISIDLSGNELSGSIPSEMGNLKLSFINLSSNQLSGEIPVALQTEAYDQSFLSNPGLCASNSLRSVPTCATRDHNLLSRLGLRILLLALGALVFLTAATLFSICVIGKYRKRRHLAAWTLTPFHSLDFTKSDIVNGIREENLIGVGGAGKVYSVTLGNRASEIVAAKKIWNGGNLDGRLEKQFQAELQILGSIRHKNIIKLLCCCSSLDSKLLVYEYMENGSLHKWLHRKHMAAGGSPHETPLDWPRRLEIAIGSARGLCYMHHDCSPPIIHRDVKSSNILLDSEFNVKIADFGLARMVAKPGEPDTASVVAGSHGYIAPECGYSRRLNEKVDVYSFGVVLLELTTGREAYDGGDDQRNLAEWSRRHLQQGGEVSDAVDPELRGSSHVGDMATVFELGILCTETSPSQRPSMKEVFRFLVRCKRA
ncbi:unnamed protein product, partial [Musa textilis]